MIRRTESPTLFNAIANDPRVRPWLGGDGPVDLTPVVIDRRNIVLATSHGGFIARALGEGRYEAHALFAANAPRQHAIRAMRAALRYVFTETDAVELFVGIPCANRAARVLARVAGFDARLCYQLPWSGNVLVPTEMSVLSITTWMAHVRQKGH